MSPEEIKELRKNLKLSARQLATLLKTEAEDVWAWESGERFPTKRFVIRMQAMKKKGTPQTKPQAEAIPNQSQGFDTTGMAKLADPQLWGIVRKLLAHPKLFSSVLKIAEQYDDPAQQNKQDTD